MLEPNKNAHLLSDLLKKVDEKKPEKETLAQVNSSFCLNKNKNKIAGFTQSLSAMRTKLSGLAKRSFVAPLLGMIDGGEVAHTAQPKSVEKAVFAKPKKVAAFTLAEVLVTLGIIGIVAAMTLPSLIGNYQKKVWATQFKRTVSTIQNQINMVNASEGVTDIFQSRYEAIYRERNGFLRSWLFKNKMATFLKLRQIFDSEDSSTTAPKFQEFVYKVNESLDSDPASNEYSGYALNDGSCIAYPYNCRHLGLKTVLDYCNILIDINCDKGPNKAGRDRFLVMIAGNGSIITNLVFDREIEAMLLESCGGNIDDDLADLYCGELIITNGWKMIY